MRTCLDSHATCKQPDESSSYRPTRLLKVNGTQTFQLVSGTTCPPTLQYAALSYCWGSKPVGGLLRLLQSTFSGLSQEQPVGKLPKTFRDAININQHFGLGYLWIDRLCIFQDSAEDWRREAATMQDVYRNALFSISALGANDDDGGCFFERDPSTVAPTVVRMKLERGGDEHTFRYDLEEGWGWRSSFHEEPLVQRSWVVQERLLAPRTLHFGSKQLFWECREASCCETHPKGVYRTDMRPASHEGFEAEPAGERHHQHFLWKQLLDAPTRLRTSDPYEQLFYDWNRTATYCTGRNLTVASDKLTALSGLANDMKARLRQLKPGPHRYLAGLWEERLMDTLLWSVRGPGKRPSEYRAPSWSWASLDGTATIFGGFMTKSVTSFASMISVETVPVGEEDTGEVKSGLLVLEGPCAHVIMNMGPRVFDPFRHQNRKDIRAIRGDSEGNRIDAHTKFNRAEAVFDTLEDFREEALLMWICARPSTRGWCSHGLLLALGHNHRYQRVGIAYCDFDSREDAQGFVEGFQQKEINII